MHLEHIGIAVADPDETAGFLARLLGIAPYSAQTIPTEQVTTYFFSAGSVKLEALESLDDASAIGRFLAKRGEGVHHLAFEVDDIHQEMDRLRRSGFTLLSDSPKPGADGKNIVFVHPHDTPGLLIEFCQAAHPIGVRWQEAPEPWLGWMEAGSPLAPRMLVVATSLHAPGEALERELSREFLLTRPAEPWSERSARFLVDQLETLPDLCCAACLNVGSALDLGQDLLRPHAGRLGFRVELGPKAGSATGPEPALILTEIGRLTKNRSRRLPESAPGWVFGVPEDVLAFCAREPRLVLDLVLRASRSSPYRTETSA